MTSKDLGTLTVKAELANLQRLMDFVNQVCEPLDLDPGTLMQLELVIEEAATNVMKFAYPKGSGELTISAGQDDNHNLILEISDTGEPFNPLETQAPDLEAELEDRPIGGLGIVLILNVMDKAEYYRMDGRNVLRLAKGLSKNG